MNHAHPPPTSPPQHTYSPDLLVPLHQIFALGYTKVVFIFAQVNTMTSLMMTRGKSLSITLSSAKVETWNLMKFIFIREVIAYCLACWE